MTNPKDCPDWAEFRRLFDKQFDSNGLTREEREKLVELQNKVWAWSDQQRDTFTQMPRR